jgi:hypothetical protein
MAELAQIFLTDYASYNDGSQFEFGHWVNLDNFDDADELAEYMRNHFAKADKKRPLDSWGSKREEIMITDFEGFPRELYSECMDFEPVFEFLNMDEGEKLIYQIAKEVDRTDLENIQFWEGSAHDWRAVDDIYEELYPEAYAAAENVPYMVFNWEQFAHECLYEVVVDGTSYLVLAE